MLTIKTQGLEFEAVDRDITIIVARLLRKYQEVGFTSVWFTKFREHFCNLLPDSIYSKGKYPPIVWGSVNAVKALVENGYLKEEVVAGKNYKVVVFVKPLDKIADAEFALLPVTYKEVDEWIEGVMHHLDDEEFKGTVIKSEHNVKDLF